MSEDKSSVISLDIKQCQCPKTNMSKKKTMSMSEDKYYQCKQNKDKSSVSSLNIIQCLCLKTNHVRFVVLFLHKLLGIRSPTLQCSYIAPVEVNRKTH